MGIYGKKDVIVHPNQHELVQQFARYPQVVYMDDAGHFPMLDNPEFFLKTIQDFLAYEVDAPEAEAPEAEEEQDQD